MKTFGMADEHGTLITYLHAEDESDARDQALDWLADKPHATCVEVWLDERDEEDELPPSFVVDRED
jgi:hypothetical protein